MNFKTRLHQLKKDIPAIFLALKKKETPWHAKTLAFLTVCYALSPIDFIPDFIPILGYLDDIIILPLLAAATIKLLPSEIIATCRIEATTLWQDGTPKKWFCHWNSICLACHYFTNFKGIDTLIGVNL